MKDLNILQEKAKTGRKKILDYICRLSSEFVDRRELLQLMAISLSSMEPMLLLGPPGTAKSDIIIKFCKGIGLLSNEYFEYMITAFTEPSEILGPINIKKMRDKGIYERILDGKIAEAKVVFLDEIFNGNSAILNTLLTIINERKIYQAGKAIDLSHLAGFFAATNHIPERRELDALKDRFVIKIHIEQVHSNSFRPLLDAGIRNDINTALTITPWIVPNSISLEDFDNVRLFIQRYINEKFQGQKTITQILDEEVLNNIYYLLQQFGQIGVEITDREVIKLTKLIFIGAYIMHGHLPDSIVLNDLFPLRYVAEAKEQAIKVRESVDKVIG